MSGTMMEINAWTLIKMGGPVMVPIILCSLFAVAIVIDKYLTFASIQTDVVSLKKKIFQCLKNNQIHEAVQLCEKNPSPVSKIMKAGIEKFGSDRSDIEQSMQDASLFEIPKLESRMSVLAAIGQVSPLLGLLGTVSGMMTCFHTIQVRSVSLHPVTPSDLAQGMWAALIATAAGLIVAVFVHVVYAYYLTRIQQTILNMERAATELVNFMGQITGAKAP